MPSLVDTITVKVDSHGKTCNPGGVDDTDSHCVVKRRVRVLRVCVAQQQRRIYGNAVKIALETHSVSGRDMTRGHGCKDSS